MTPPQKPETRRGRQPHLLAAATTAGYGLRNSLVRSLLPQTESQIPVNPVLPDPVPLSPDEDRFWRAFARMILVTARALEHDLQDRSSLSFSEYGILMNLSEAPGREMNMSDLARQVALSPSHIGRIVGAMERDGLVTRAPSADDRRVQIASLTSEGLERLVRAWPAHLASARSRVVDQIDASHLQSLTKVMEDLVTAAEGQLGDKFK